MMDLSRLNERLVIIGGVKGVPFHFYAEVRKPTVKEFVSGELPAEKATVNFFTHYEVGSRLDTGTRLEWRGSVYDVTEISIDYSSYAYTVIKCIKTSIRSDKNPFTTY